MDDYAFYCYVQDLPELTVATRLEVERMTARGNAIGADRLLMAFDALKTSLIALEAQMAVEGTRILRESERTTRVRPPSLTAHSGDSGERLENHLFVEPLSTLLWGSVGVANETELDATVPWWVTNEVGSSARIGGKALIGLFEPGDAEPSGAEFRVHPIFQPGPGGGSGAIRNPIPARRFVEKSLPQITAAWRAGFDAAKDEFVSELTAAQVGLLA